MAIVSFKEMLEDATARKYAVPMFDISNTTMMKAAVEVAEEMGSPVILASIPPDIEGNLLDYWVNGAKFAAQQVKVPVCLHLDHSPTVELCARCADAGYNSVMLDASAEDFATNSSLCKQVVDMVKSRGIHVEAELGHVASGITGAANGMAENGRSADSETVFTDPESVVRFIEETKVDALAISIGTTHGVYVSAPELNIPLLKEIKKVCDVPLVLHGGSGTPEDQLKEAIANGIAKINIYSELTAAFNTELKKFLMNREQMTCWFSVLTQEPDRAMREAMREKMVMFNSINKF